MISPKSHVHSNPKNTTYFFLNTNFCSSFGAKEKKSNLRPEVIKVLLDGAIIFMVNLPFGYLRGKEKKFSFRWFLYIHLPIPLVILVRVLSHIGFALYTYPLFVGAFFLGQLVGKKMYHEPE